VERQSPEPLATRITEDVKLELLLMEQSLRIGDGEATSLEYRGSHRTLVRLAQQLASVKLQTGSALLPSSPACMATKRCSASECDRMVESSVKSLRVDLNSAKLGHGFIPRITCSAKCKTPQPSPGRSTDPDRQSHRHSHRQDAAAIATAIATAIAKTPQPSPVEDCLQGIASPNSEKCLVHSKSAYAVHGHQIVRMRTSPSVPSYAFPPLSSAVVWDSSRASYSFSPSPSCTVSLRSARNPIPGSPPVPHPACYPPYPSRLIRTRSVPQFVGWQA